MKQRELAKWKQSVGRMAIATAIETDGIKDTTEIEWNTDDLKVTVVQPVNDLEDGDAGFEVEATTTATESEQVTRARNHPPGKAHPAEYKEYDVDIHVQIRFFPSRNNGLGAAGGLVQADGGAPSPPSRQ